MKRLALIAALVSTAAIAQADDHHWNNDDRHGDYDRHTDEGRRDVEPRRNSVTLATMDISRKETIDVDPRYSWSRLRIQAARGAAYVDFVTVRFGNGEQEHIDVHRRIGRGEYADIEVNGRHLQAVTVHGRPDRWSQIQVIAQQ